MLYKGKLYRWTPVPNNSESKAKPTAGFLPAAPMKNLKHSLANGLVLLFVSVRFALQHVYAVF